MSMVKRAVNIFLNLEKCNNIKKHARKLYLSGSFSTDPFEILNAEKLFTVSCMYSRQRVRQGDPLSPYLLLQPKF